jgi:general secretion pathway protein G
LANNDRLTVNSGRLNAVRPIQDGRNRPFRSPITDRRSPFTDHSSQITVHRSPVQGFTLVELLIVIALLLTIAVPRYYHSVDRAREAVLKQDLAQMRDAIDKYHGDRGRYPDSLEDLVTHKYLRKIPLDPITESTTSWLTVPPAEADKGNVFDVKSGATGTAIDGTSYAEW